MDFVSEQWTSSLRTETFQIVLGIIRPIPKAERLQPNRHFGPPLTLAGATPSPTTCAAKHDAERLCSLAGGSAESSDVWRPVVPVAVPPVPYLLYQ